MFEIIYYLILDSHENYSLFSGFGTNILKENNSLLEIINLPLDIFEVVTPKIKWIEKRRNSKEHYRIQLIQYDKFEKIIEENIFSVIITKEQYFKQIECYTNKWKYKPMFLFSDCKNEFSLENISQEKIYNFFEPRIKSLMSIGILNHNIIYKKKKGFVETIELNEIAYTHLTTNIIINTIESFNYRLINKKQSSAHLSNEPYIKQIVETNNILLNILQNLETNYIKDIWNIDLIFTSAPMIKNKFSINRDSFIEKEIIKYYRKLAKQKDYFLSIKSADITDITNPVFQSLVKERLDEVLLYSTILTILSATYLCPILRISPEIDSGCDLEIKNLIGSLKSVGQKIKHPKCLKILQEKVQKIIPKEFLGFIVKDRVNKIKIYSNGPVEFCHSNSNKRLPLFLEHMVCKVPTTPGNVFAKNSLFNHPRVFEIDDITNILIIRSFKENDNAKYVLEKSINIFFNGISKEESFIQKVKYKIVDINNEIELIITINNSTENIVIFDCHGGCDDDYSFLLIGDQKINFASINALKVLPPIVILSACLTHNYSFAQNSVANSFLQAGAYSVLSTNSPIDVNDAGNLIARILYRINDYFDSIFDFRKGLYVTWLEFISGMQKMNYLTEILRYFLDNEKISNDNYFELHTKGNIYINCNDVNWFDYIVFDLSRYLQINAEDIYDIISNNIGFTNSMRYTLLGNADCILITKKI